VSEIHAKIESGLYKGRTVTVHFGRPLKIMCGKEDITSIMMELHIEISARGQILHLKLAELDYSQFKTKE
jgi:hypothetical protein